VREGEVKRVNESGGDRKVEREMGRDGEKGTWTETETVN
jgi:hypothetical protein